MPSVNCLMSVANRHGKYCLLTGLLTSCADQARDAVGDAKARLNKAAEDAARSAQEAADSVRPHTAEVFLRRLYSCFLLVKSCKKPQ